MGVIQDQINRFQSLYTQTCADIDQAVAELRELADANDFATLQTNANAVRLLAANASYQRDMLDYFRARLTDPG